MIFHDNNGSSHYIRVADYNCYKNDTLLVCVRQEKSSIANGNPTKGDLEKYTFPVPSNSTFVDLGNDSYEYAKYERDIAYKNFGLNIVQVAKSFDSNIIYFTKLNGEKFYIKEPNGGNDTFLVYSNINPKFFDGWHICNDSLCTPENFTKIEEDGYGYIFRGKIYSKDETEKCWNIIEQYKLRESEKQTQQ